MQSAGSFPRNQQNSRRSGGGNWLVFEILSARCCTFPKYMRELDIYVALILNQLFTIKTSLWQGSSLRFQPVHHMTRSLILVQGVVGKWGELEFYWPKLRVCNHRNNSQSWLENSWWQEVRRTLGTKVPDIRLFGWPIGLRANQSRFASLTLNPRYN